MWRAARLLDALPVGARVNSGTDPITWAVRELYGALTGEQHPTIQAEVEKAGRSRRQRLQAKQAEQDARRARQLAAQAAPTP